MLDLWFCTSTVVKTPIGRVGSQSAASLSPTPLCDGIGPQPPTTTGDHIKRLNRRRAVKMSAPLTFNDFCNKERLNWC